MSAMSNVLENFLVQHIFRTGSWTKPTALYIALYTSATDDADGGTEVSSTDTGYARAQLDPLDANWAATSGTDGHTQNTGAITFPTPSGGTNWGQVTHFGIHTSSTGTGNRLLHGSLTTPKTINQGDPAPSFASGDLDVTFA